MTRVLVTGGTGFIGSALVRALLKQGHHVRVFDNDSRGNFMNLQDVCDNIDLVKGDIRILDDVQNAVKGMDTVFHLAYVNGTENFYKRPALVLDVGVRGTLNMIDASQTSGVENFIYASSSEIYQLPAQIPTPEEVPGIVPDVKNPRYSYGAGKLIGELMTLHYANAQMRRIIFRPHNIYGPQMGWEHVVPQFIKKIAALSCGFSLKKIIMPIQGKGLETRAFCYIDDAIDGIMAAAQRGTSGEIYHVGKDEEITILDLVKKIAEILDMEIAIQESPLQAGSTPRRCPDITRLKSLGYCPKISLHEGLIKTMAWYKEVLTHDKSYTS